MADYKAFAEWRNSVKLPAWGEGLFENHNDMEAILYLDKQLGIVELENRANSITAEELKNRPDSYYEKYKKGVHYSVHAWACSSKQAVEFVRRYLDGGVLAKLCEKMIARYFNPMKQDDYTCHGHLPLLLGACAMTLGCKLSGLPSYKMFFPTYKDLLSGICETTPIMDRAKQQMQQALANYQDGKPHHFDSKASLEVMAAREAAGIKTPLSQEKFSKLT